ncbi:hypothetical protein DOY81_002747 [Sarcophaga bullata]|nr:hypothetical protein DOY81_002747 [Sarcophaga bullata]
MTSIFAAIEGYQLASPKDFNMLPFSFFQSWTVRYLKAQSSKFFLPIQLMDFCGVFIKSP